MTRRLERSVDRPAASAHHYLPLRIHSSSARLLLVFSVVAIAVLTLTPAADERHRPPFWCFSCGDRVANDMFLNVLLFIPLGAALGLLRVRALGAAAMGFFLSTAVELLQYGIPGREPSARDVLTNTIGTILGAWIASAFFHSGRAVRAVR